jgi:trans-aconitate methyltransferase
MYTWNPQDYAQHSHIQESWARELLTQIDLRPDDIVLDIGSGDGRTTAAIAANVPNGHVVGIDLSSEMIAHATAQHSHPRTNNIRFVQADAAALPFESEFSVVFSNAALHWVQDQRAAVHGIARALRPGGRLIAQCGGRGNVAAVIATFERVAASPPWRDVSTPGEMPYRFHDASDYKTWLEEARLEVQECRLIQRDMVHENHSTFIGWLRTAWHPHTAGVALELRDSFLEETASRYIAAHPLDNHGRVHVAAVRLQVRARKPGSSVSH